MGTRSLTFVYEKYGQVQKPVCNMYRQYDGYPTGHGAELADFLSGGRLVNGLIATKTVEEIVFNGMGCLAASMVAHFKQTPGGFYIHPVDTIDCGQDYEYHIYDKDGLYIEVYNCGCNFFGVSGGDKHELVFGGYLKDFTKYCNPEKDKEIEMNTPLQQFENSLIGQEVLKQELKKGVVSVLFEKVNGSERNMKCTLSNDIIPLFDTTGVTVTKKRTPNDDVLAVWDIEANGWRSFRFDSIKSIVYPSVV